MKLWVDDIRKAPEGWHHAWTVTQAIRVLDTAPHGVDEVSLDHDISHDITLDRVARPFPCPETFEPVARHIARMKDPPKVTIHTANSVGRVVMQQILLEAGVQVRIAEMKPCNRLEGR